MEDHSDASAGTSLDMNQAGHNFSLAAILMESGDT
jgi:hypothetical protein